MDETSHFVFILAAVLIIIVCLIWLAGIFCIWAKAKKIKKDLGEVIQDIKELSKLLRSFSPEGYEHAKGEYDEAFSYSKPTLEMGPQNWFRTYGEAFSYPNAPGSSLHPPGSSLHSDYPPENDDRHWRGPNSQYHYPYFN